MVGVTQTHTHIQTLQLLRIYLDFSSASPGSGGGASGMPRAEKRPELEGRRGEKEVGESDMAT